MARPILMPQVGQDLTEGKIVAINVKLGDMVKKGDIVAEVESEKATFEVEAFESGTVVDLPFKVGDTAIVLKPLMMVGDEGEVLTPGPSAAIPAGAAHAPVIEIPIFAGTIEKAGSSPLARRLADEAGIDIRKIVGSGPAGVVVKKDIEDLAGAAGRMSTSAEGMRGLRPGTGDPVLFIHGFGADLSAWRPFVLNLAIDNPIFALDLPAHGTNAGIPVHDFESLTAAVRTAIQTSGVKRLHLAGHSLGAAVAARLAADSELEVRSLTLISPAGLGPKINGDYIDGFLAATSEPALRAWLELLMHKSAMLPAALIRATLSAREGTDMAANQRKAAAGLFSGNTQLFSIHDALERYAGPARVIVGMSDRIIPPAYTDTLPAHVSINRMPQVGHLPQLEAAALTARLVAETVRSAG